MNPVLQVGSPAAQALYQLWTGKHLVRLRHEPGGDLGGFTVACLVVQHLLESNPAARVMFVADPGTSARLQMRINGLRGHEVRCRLLAMEWGSFSRSMPFYTHNTPGEPVDSGPLRVGVRDAKNWQDSGAVTDLLVFDPLFAGHAAPAVERWCSRTRQALVIERPEQACPSLGPLRRIVVGHQPPVWGELPMQVVLAGAPD